MTDETRKRINELRARHGMPSQEVMDESHARSNREALLQHARLGQSVCEGGPDGQVIWITPAEIFARYGLDEFGREKQPGHEPSGPKPGPATEVFRMGDPVRLELTGDEALVLFDFLARFDDDGTLAIADQAEERTLWNLHCLLQKQLVEIFHPEYQALLAAARDRLRDPAV